MMEKKRAESASRLNINKYVASVGFFDRSPLVQVPEEDVSRLPNLDPLPISHETRKLRVTLSRNTNKQSMQMAMNNVIALILDHED